MPIGRSAGSRLLDVGCGNGAFLEIAKDAGWVVHGIDFDPDAVAEARRRGLDVSQGGLEQVEQQAGTFDWITCSHVIEHVHEPTAWLRRMHALLKPGGTLWIQTPNIESLGHRAFGVDWLGLDPPRHLTLFSLPALRNALKDAGFAPQPKALPAISAMAVYAASETLRDGGGMLTAVSPSQLLRPRYQFRAVVQSLRTQRAEFVTFTAIKS